MKIVIDGRLIGTSTGRYVSKLLEYLQKIDNENEYVVLLNNQSWAPTASNFITNQVDVARFSVSEQTKLKRVLEKIDPDLVHFPDFNQPLFYEGKTVTTIHDLTMLRFNNTRPKEFFYNLKYLLKKQLLKVFLQRIVKKSTKVISPSNFTAEDIKKNYRRGATVTYESADEIENIPESVLELKNKRFLFYVGNAYPHKNLKKLVDAFSVLQKNNKNLHLVIAGKKDAFHEDLINYAKSKEVKNFLHLGFVSDAQLRWLYENAECYLFPSLSEGFGLPGLEAMQHGLPVVSSNKACLPEIYGDAAHYFNPEDADDIAVKTSEVINNDELKEKLVANGFERLKSYSWERMAEKTLSLYLKAYEE